MALTTAEALLHRVAQTFSVSVAAASLTSYAPVTHVPAAVVADGSAATNTVELCRTTTGDVLGIRANAGVVLSKRILRTPEHVMEFIYEGTGGTDTEIGSPEV